MGHPEATDHTDRDRLRVAPERFSTSARGRRASTSARGTSTPADSPPTSRLSADNPFVGRPNDLGGKHLLQRLQHHRNSVGPESPDPLCQAATVHGSYLVYGHKARTALEATRNPPRIRPAARRHRCDDGRSEISIECVGRDDQTGPCLPDFAASRRVQAHKVDIPTRRGAASYHVHSRSSKLFGRVGSSNPSSPDVCICSAASAQPARGTRAAVTTSRPGSARSSTSSGSSAWSSKTFGTRKPRELPMRTMRVVVGM